MFRSRRLGAGANVGIVDDNGAVAASNGKHSAIRPLICSRDRDGIDVRRVEDLAAAFVKSSLRA